MKSGWQMKGGSASALLYVTTTIPSPSGNGAAMRAFSMVEALAHAHAVTCLVVPVWGVPFRREVPRELEALAEVHIVESSLGAIALRRLLLRDAVRGPVAKWLAALWPHPLDTLGISRSALVRRVAGRRFDVIHAFKWHSLPLAEAFRKTGTLTLDLDDLEPETLSRFAALSEAAGNHGRASAQRAEAGLAEAYLAKHVPRCARVFVCSEVDRGIFQGRFPNARISVAPNIVRELPEVVVPEAGPPHRIVFVGTFAYAPNVDGLKWFAREVLPELRRQVVGELRVDVIGPGSDKAVRGLGQVAADVRGWGKVPSVSPHLASAHVVIAPIRAGGGTRIKILEGLAHGRPVVSTTVGAEGLALKDGVHLRVGDSPSGFARACAELLADPALAHQLAAAGRERVAACYSRAALRRAVSDADVAVDQGDP